MELLSLPLLLSLLSVAFLAGLVDAIAGGGGLLMMPALLSVGIPPHLALGTNKMASTFGTFTAARVCIRKGIFQPKLWPAAIIATFIGALLGTLITGLVSPQALKKLLPVVILLAAVYIFFHHPTPPTTTTSLTTPPSRTSSGLLGSVLGFYDGFIGPGTGTFWTIAAMAVYKVNIIEASGIARFMNLISNMVSLTTFIWLSHVDYLLGLSLGIALMSGAYIGIHSALKFGAPLIRPVFMVVVFATAGRLIWLEWL